MQLVLFAVACIIGIADASVSARPRRAIAIIDVTNEQYVTGKAPPGNVWNNVSVLEKIEWLVSGHADAPVWDAIFTCQNYIYSPEDSAFWDAGKPAWVGGKPGSVGADLVPRLAKLRDAAKGTPLEWRFIGKPTYSCFDNTAMEHAVQALKINELYFVGINTEQCVLFSAYDGWRQGVADKFFVVEDACSSGFGKEGHDMGLKMFKSTGVSDIIAAGDIPKNPKSVLPPITV